MKRMFVVTVVLGLGGCSTAPVVDYAAQMRAEQDARDASSQRAAERVQSDRDAYINAHPESKFKQEIAEGFIHIGMSPDEVEAAGFDCRQKEFSTIGHIDQCKRIDLEMEAADDSVVPSDFVGYGSDDRVESINHG
ncbi:hypothetical protein [Frateuria terrea]|uniref:hypothetical protein n=1 Tax=Frateuria terrea TaxID=529704 RepID=UPI000B830423|nr:hypothetical protein [Frateuria terrea]